MKLQVNDTGAWKNVVKFGSEDLDLVKTNAGLLGEAAQGVEAHVKFRVVDDFDKVCFYWEPARGWFKSLRNAGLGL
jgi:hypothetical protein